ncbi:MAG: flavodoxin [Solobacterium sp.]|nr:flavodoxin [Solobacterium sp.]
MKKTVIAFISSLLVLCGCSASQPASEEPVSEAETETAETEETAEPEESVKKELLVYFSRAGENWDVGVVEKGNTRIAAEYIAEKTGADVFEIIPVVPYPENYNETLAIAQEEKDNQARPEIKNVVVNWESYETIILGYPIWHGDLPIIVYTFLESYDFTGKTVYPFNTHGGSGLAGTPDKIRAVIPGADVRDGLALTGKTVQNDFGSVQPEIDARMQENNLMQ